MSKETTPQWITPTDNQLVSFIVVAIFYPDEPTDHNRQAIREMIEDFPSIKREWVIIYNRVQRQVRR